MVARKWLDKEVSLNPIKELTIAVIGYGIQGSAQACNMKDSGINVIVGLRPGGKSWTKAEISDNKTISFSHGAAIYWKWIVSPDNVDIIMVAPKGPGQKVRELYLDGFGTPSLVAVHQDYSKKAWDKVLGLAKSIGSTRPGVIETNFKEEVETDWFGEQVDLCGGVHNMVIKSFETLVEAGYQPEIAYFECLHELKLIVDLIQKYGITGMYNRVSETARYGGLTRGKRVIDQNSKNNMKQVLTEIQSGQFAKEWVDSYRKDSKTAFAKLLQDVENHEIEKVGKDLRKMMWPNDVIT